MYKCCVIFLLIHMTFGENEDNSKYTFSTQKTPYVTQYYIPKAMVLIPAQNNSKLVSYNPGLLTQNNQNSHLLSNFDSNSVFTFPSGQFTQKYVSIVPNYPIVSQKYLLNNANEVVPVSQETQKYVLSNEPSSSLVQRYVLNKPTTTSGLFSYVPTIQNTPNNIIQKAPTTQQTIKYPSGALHVIPSPYLAQKTKPSLPQNTQPSSSPFINNNLAQATFNQNAQYALSQQSLPQNVPQYEQNSQSLAQYPQQFVQQPISQFPSTQKVLIQYTQSDINPHNYAQNIPQNYVQYVQNIPQNYAQQQLIQYAQNTETPHSSFSQFPQNNVAQQQPNVKTAAMPQTTQNLQFAQPVQFSQIPQNAKLQPTYIIPSQSLQTLAAIHPQLVAQLTAQGQKINAQDLLNAMQQPSYGFGQQPESQTEKASNKQKIR